MTETTVMLLVFLISGSEYRLTSNSDSPLTEVLNSIA